MGLVIHWKLKAPKGSRPDQLLEQIGRQALNLPVTSSPVLYFNGLDASFDNSDKDDPWRWLKIQAVRYVYGPNIKPRQSISQSPVEFFALSIQPGNGCEQANFGLARYPKCSNWVWESWCKTQYANIDGIENFLKCHLSVINLLDAAKELGCLVSVNDDSSYWKKRDIAALVKEVDIWDQFVAAIAGKLKDCPGLDNVTAPIFKRPDFEQLEFKGLKALNGEQ